MAPPRSLRPKEEPPSNKKKDDPSEKSGKKRVVSTACIPCRRRKSKCDGALPACSTCTAVYRTKCVYDAETEAAVQSSASRRSTRTPSTGDDSLEVIIASLRSLPESESISLLHNLRSEADPQALAETLKTNVNLPQGFGHQTLEADFAEHLATPPIGRGAGEDPASPPWEGSAEDREQLSGAVAAWFRTVQDAEFVDHLMDLFFCWIHPFHQFFSREHFLRDMGRGRKDFCSAMLVNAVLAFACHYSDRYTARTDRRNPSTAGDQFFAVAKEELDASDTPCLTTVQALAVMSVRESSRGRDSVGYQYAGRCVRMALEMGLHLSLIGDGMREAENQVRKVTYWGIFNLETMISVCVGRMSQLPRVAADVQKPVPVDAIEMQEWAPYADVDLSPETHVQEPGRSTTFMNQLSSLSEIASDMVNDFYTPRDPFTSRRLAAAYGRYQDWYNRLPNVFAEDDTSLPHAIVLHMYYHACVLHLFRPYIRLDLKAANLYPRDTCTASANKISELMDGLRDLYGVRRTCQLVPSLLLSASTIHLLNLPDDDSTDNLRQGVRDLQAMSTNHRFAGRCIEIVQSLARKWSISLPEPLATITAVPYDVLPSPSASNFWTASIGQQSYFESRAEAVASTMTAQNPAFMQAAASIPRQQLQPFQPVYSGAPMELDVHQTHHPIWTPFPAQTMPISPQQQHLLPPMSTMGFPQGGDEAWQPQRPPVSGPERGSALPYRGGQQQSGYRGQGQPSDEYEQWPQQQWQ